MESCKKIDFELDCSSKEFKDWRVISSMVKVYQCDYCKKLVEVTDEDWRKEKFSIKVLVIDNTTTKYICNKCFETNKG
jgi:hypothetical protein